MPDLDQHRDPATWDAARNIGKMYCGAATVANVLSYLHHEGFEDIDVPDIDFEPIDIRPLTGAARMRAIIHNDRGRCE